MFMERLNNTSKTLKIVFLLAEIWAHDPQNMKHVH